MNNLRKQFEDETDYSWWDSITGFTRQYVEWLEKKAVDTEKVKVVCEVYKELLAELRERLE